VWTPWVKQTLLASDEIVIVATPDLASLRNAKALADLLKQGRPNDIAPKLVLNQIGTPKRPEIPAKDFAETVGIAPSLLIPFEPGLFGAAANNGQMLPEVQPKSQVADGIRRLAELVTGRAAQNDSQKGALPIFSFLKGRKQA
jgi:pilus assembly protein CpaE